MKFRSPNSESKPRQSLDALFPGGGEMGELVRRTDWAATKLGPVEEWPMSLRTMLGVVLGSRFPMLLWWGPDLLHLYNDAYRPILREKHPESWVEPAAKVWAEVWDVAGPLARSVQEGGPATWTEDLQLFIKSGEMAEETYFTFSYSPVPGDDGKVAGLLNTVQETTAKVQGERQIRMLHDLSVRCTEARSEEEAYRVVADVLAANDLDVPFVLLYEFEGTEAKLRSSAGLEGYEGRASDRRVSISESETSRHWPFSDVLRTKHEVVCEGLTSRFRDLPGRKGRAKAERAILLPLFRAGSETPFACLVAGVSPHRRLNERYLGFFEATSAQVVSALANARNAEIERKRAETLAELDRAKTAFFNNVSHEFRTPLTLMLAPVEESLRSSRRVLGDSDLELVHRNMLRLLRLVNSLLDFARLESGRLEPSFAKTDLAVLTRDLAGTFRSLIEGAGIEFVVTSSGLREGVYVDPAHWEKIVLNLLSNAFKYTFNGRIDVRLFEERGAAKLVVSDTGVGIPEAELPRIFERFHRVEGSQGRSFEGSGIGLSIVRDLVELHGGTITASSSTKGSSFEVSLPLGREHLPSERIVDRANLASFAESYVQEASRWSGTWQDTWDTSRRTESAGAGATRVPPPSGRRGGRVLIVDDNPDMRDYLAKLLSPYWDIECFVNGRAALASAEANPPDLVLSDVMMPGMNGFELVEALRTRPSTNQVPIVLLSARAGEEALENGLETGADDYLVKPFTARELVARVRTHLELARSRRNITLKMELANRELEAFSYSVSHDLRTPLRAITGFGQALREECGDGLGEVGEKYLTRVLEGAERMRTLIDDLLALSRISHGPLSRTSIDLAELAERVCSDLRARDPAREVEFRIQRDLWTVGDVQLLTILLENLLGNSWKFTSKREGAWIEVGKLNTTRGRIFFVSDNGAGFDVAHATKLFTPFQRFHTQTEFEGTGIGLATVHRIVTRHGGRVWAVSAPGNGASFFFRLEEDGSGGV